MYDSIALALYKLAWTPVPPTVASIDSAIDDLGLWPVVTVSILLGLVIFLFRRLSRR